MVLVSFWCRLSALGESFGDPGLSQGIPEGATPKNSRKTRFLVGFWSPKGVSSRILRWPPRVLFGGHLAPGLPGRPDPDGENVELSSSLPAPGPGPGRQAVPPGARRGPGTILEGIPMTVIFDIKVCIILVWI